MQHALVRNLMRPTTDQFEIFPVPTTEDLLHSHPEIWEGWRQALPRFPFAFQSQNLFNQWRVLHAKALRLAEFCHFV